VTTVDLDEVARNTVTDIDGKTFAQECMRFKIYIRNTVEKKQPDQSLVTFFRNQNLTVSEREHCFKDLFLYGGWQLFGGKIVFVSQED